MSLHGMCSRCSSTYLPGGAINSNLADNLIGHAAQHAAENVGLALKEGHAQGCEGKGKAEVRGREGRRGEAGKIQAFTVQVAMCTVGCRHIVLIQGLTHMFYVPASRKDVKQGRFPCSRWP